MNDNDKERIFVQERLHWVIFIPPLLVMAALMAAAFAATLPAVAFLSILRNALRPLAPQVSLPFGNSMILVALLPGVVIGLLLLVAAGVAYWKSRITLSDRRLVFRTGLLARVTGELPLENVEAIILAEPPLGRMLGYGTVTVTSLGGLQFPLRFLASAQHFHATLQTAIATAKSRTRPAHNTTPPIQDDARYMPKG